ncbi:glycoside hydrolase family 3 protein [Angustibacter peucedani]
MSLAQQVGQLVMVGGPAKGVGDRTLDAITEAHVGNAMLTGRSSAGVAATARVSAKLQARATRAATAGVPLLVATDQEGGLVQVLRGDGFTDVPSGLTQGSWSPDRLQRNARTWGQQLRRAGVRVDLAPVADTVPEATKESNAPIGHFDREYGADSRTVASHVVAFVRGMAAAGVVTTPKHFPGLGRVVGNTDTTADVTDDVTSRTSSYLEPWRAAIAAGAPVVMTSSAVYSRIDPDHPACFSRTVVTGLLRGDLGFDGVVISDDLGQAVAVRRWSPGSRATQFVAAGGDLVLTVDPRQAGPMAAALLAKSRASATFRAQVAASALRVLRLKQSVGLLATG